MKARGVALAGGDVKARFLAFVVAGVMLAGCSGGPILANPPIVFPTPGAASPAPAPPADPIPIVLPRDDGPHDRMTEWWYYTGHLTAVAGGEGSPAHLRRFGFEAVVFRAERGSVPAAWASHLALTDEDGQRFLYAQRSEIGPQVDRSPRDAEGTPTGFDLRVGGLSPVLIAQGAPPVAPPWQLAGSGGTDRIEATLSGEEAEVAGAPFGLALDLAPTKPPALHDHNGFVDFGPAGGSYYYSRTRLIASGEVTLDDTTYQVNGIAWFDHQWGDFVSVGGGGWDWVAINLPDGTDLTASVVRDSLGEEVARYGTLVAPDGTVRHLTEDDVRFEPSDRFPPIWQSPVTGRAWPAGWTVAAGDLVVNLRPTVPGQELDTRATTGVVYWEGSQIADALRAGFPIASGEAYVEITRYGE